MYVVQDVVVSDVIVAQLDYMSWYQIVTQRFIRNPAHRRDVPDGYHSIGPNAVQVTNAVEESLIIAFDAISRSQCEVSRSTLKKIKDFMSRALGIIGDGLGCGSSSTHSSHVVEPSRNRPRNKILSR